MCVGNRKKYVTESNHGLATSATPIITELELATISKPTLVIAGTEDPIFPSPHAEVMSKAIPGAQLLLIKKWDIL